MFRAWFFFCYWTREFRQTFLVLFFIIYVREKLLEVSPSLCCRHPHAENVFDEMKFSYYNEFSYDFILISEKND